MAGLESCQLSLMNVDFCCRPLKSVLLWPGTMQGAKPSPPPAASRLQLLELLEMCIGPSGKDLSQEVLWVSVAF